MRNDLFPVHAGFLPLIDSAILVVGSEKGFAEDEVLVATPLRFRAGLRRVSTSRRMERHSLQHPAAKPCLARFSAVELAD